MIVVILVSSSEQLESSSTYKVRQVAMLRLSIDILSAVIY